MTTAVLERPSRDLSEAEVLGDISRKLDNLTQTVALLGEQVQFLSELAYENRRRQREWDELRSDLTPIVKDLYNVSVEQMQEIQDFATLDEMLQLLKRLARSTRLFNELLGQAESLYDLWRDLSPLSKEMFDGTVGALDTLERRGYFGFARQGTYVLDQIVTSFSEEEVKQLGDNVVMILNTLKSLTQPEMLSVVNRLTEGYREVDDHPEEVTASVFGLLKQMRDPDVRRGLSITMTMLKRMSQQTQ